MQNDSKYQVLTIKDTFYPKRLKNLKNAPKSLYVDGVLPTESLSVAVVGSRAAFHRNMELAFTMGGHIASRGGMVVSGGAMGIDAAAHEGALKKDGHTVAVMGAGLNHCYPKRNKALFEKIKKSGALLSEYFDPKPPKTWQFVRRNRIIAGLADWVVVVQANKTSGALHTARFAMEYGKQLAAVPGSAGCDDLLEHGAVCVDSINRFKEVLSGKEDSAAVAKIQLSTLSQMVFSAMDSFGPHDLKSMCDATGLSTGEVFGALAELEFEGFLVEDKDAQFWVTADGKRHIEDS